MPLTGTIMQKLPQLYDRPEEHQKIAIGLRSRDEELTDYYVSLEELRQGQIFSACDLLCKWKMYCRPILPPLDSN